MSIYQSILTFVYFNTASIALFLTSLKFVVIYKKKTIWKSRYIWQKLKCLLSYGRILSRTTVVRNVCLLFAHMRKDLHATLQLHCQWWSGQCHAKHAENAASVHNACLDKIVCYLQRICNSNRKMKQQVSKLSELKFKNQCILHFGLHFLPAMPKLKFLTFAR